MGDNVDNIPGVEKCGPKTAAKWLSEYGTLDAVIAHADAIGGKVGENLRAALPRLPLNRQLITIKTDVALAQRSEEHTSELQSLMRISYAVFCLKKKNQHINTNSNK